MGLFGKSKKKKKSAPKVKPVAGSLQSLEYWKGLPPNPVGTYRIPPDEEHVIYNYDGACLAGLKVGDEFVVNPIPADVTLKSAYTGYITSTRLGDVAYVYNGKVFGMSAFCAKEIRNLMRKGYIVEVEARIVGFDDQLGYAKVMGKFGKPEI